MDNLIADIRYGIRSLLRNPGFTTIAVVALALGIGGNSAIFSVVNTLLLKPLPFSDPGRLVYLSELSPQISGMSVSWPNYEDWKKQNTVFIDLGAFRNAGFNMAGSGDPERLAGAEITASMFSTLGLAPVFGRGFRPDEDRPGGERVAVLSEGLWRRRFGSDPSAVGRVLTLNGEPFTIVGVMPVAFAIPPNVEIWTSLGRRSDQMQQRGSHPGIYAIGRLKPGLTVANASQEFETIALNLEKQYPDTNTNNRITVTGLHERFVGQLRPALLVLLAAVAFVLLIACANVANLLLARATSREREIAVRMAIGAGRLRLVRQLLTESVLLAFIGGALGLVLAFLGIRALVAATPSVVPRISEVGMDPAVLAFTFLISLLTGLIFGLVPALQTARPEMHGALKEGGRGNSQGGGHRMRAALVVAEVSLSLILLIGAGLMIKSFLKVWQVDPGFRSDGVLTLQVLLPVSKYSKPSERQTFFLGAVERIQSLPGVSSGGAVNKLPMFGGGNQTSFSVVGQPDPEQGRMPLTDIAAVAGDYFQSMGIPLVRGEFLTERDGLERTNRIVVDETMAQRYWPDEDPLGKQIRLGGPNIENPVSTIVGVVRHVKNYGVDQDSRVETYVGLGQNPATVMYFTVKAPGDLLALVPAVRNAIRQIDPDLPLYNIQTMETVVANNVAPRRLAVWLMAIFSAVALALAGVGIYGVMSYSVTQRTHEIGIRMALGARRVDVLQMVVGQGLLLIAAGVTFGLLASFGLMRLLAGLLFGVSASDPVTFVAIPMLLAAVAVVASYLPARRAMRVDPMIALRCE